MRSKQVRSRFTTVMMMTFGLVALGCGSEAVSTDPNQSIAILTQTLQQWREGTPIESVREKEIHVNDHRWQEEFQLEDFTVSDTAEPLGHAVRCHATLVVKSPAGKKSTETAFYAVTPAPKVTVIRIGEDW